MSLVVNPLGTPATALVLQRLIDAPAALVFAAWSDPEHVAAWWHPDGYTTPVFEMDFRVGGAYRYCIRKDGVDHWARGSYQEIVVPSRIAFTFQWQSGDAAHDAETLVTVTFEPDGERTLLTFRQESFAAASARHGHSVGWGQVLETFASFVVATVSSPLPRTPS
ncbi:MAG: SRPBCC domain-containing protein [Rhizobacter sp.]|nr:SRPBCC domain-containing protein [Rhizobacter sp.]